MTSQPTKVIFPSMSMKITEALLAEHVVFHCLFDHIERSLPSLKTLAEVRTVSSILESLLEGHARVEDELIVEPLEHCLQQLGQQETFHEEHEEIDASLQAIRKAKDLRTARRLLRDAVVASRTHFDKEERLIFPMAEKVLKARTLSVLGESWMRQRKAIVG